MVSKLTSQREEFHGFYPVTSPQYRHPNIPPPFVGPNDPIIYTSHLFLFKFLFLPMHKGEGARHDGTDGKIF
jgi:hypothetical protein